MKQIFLAVLAAVFLIVASVTAAPQSSTTVLQALKDNTLIEDAAGALSNGQGDSLFVGKTNQPKGGIRRALIAFDLDGKIPSCANIKSVTLTLQARKAAGEGKSVPIKLHRVLSNWGEGESNSQGGRGAAAEKDDATWLYSFYDRTTWQNSGGDFSPRASGVQPVSGANTYTWNSTAAMVADVQMWLNSPEKNFGWLLEGNETTKQTVKSFASRETTDMTAKPQLTVNFVKPGSC